MPNDAYTLSFLARELRAALINGKVNKIVQPEKDEIVLTIYTGATHRLLLSANAANPRCHLTNYAKENPAAAPQFVMTLRKHLTGGTLTAVDQPGGDRILAFTFVSKNELKDEESKRLIVEIMGKYSNIILVDGRDRILGAVKSVSFDVSSVRQIFNGLTYALPPRQSECTVFRPQGLEQALTEYAGGSLAGFLQTHLCGLAKSTAQELVARSGVCEGKPLEGAEIARVCGAVRSLSPENVDPKPGILFRENRMADFFAFPYESQFGEFRPCETLNRAADEFYYLSDKQKRFQEHSRALCHQVRTQISKLEKKKGLLLQKLADCEKLEEERVKGELLTANLYAVRHGMTEVTVLNYYDNTQIKIALDARLTPSQNAQSHYRRYAKLKTGKQHAEKNLLECEELLDYLYTVEESFEKCTEIAELAEIRRELCAQGLVKSEPQAARGGKREAPTRPIRHTFRGFVILVGKNNLQNDELTFRTASPTDLWLHTKDVHGSHTVVLADGRPVPDEVVTCACELAAYYSKARESGKTAVDYTLVKFVKKPRSAKPGFVIYTDFRTAYVAPCEHADLRSTD